MPDKAILAGDKLEAETMNRIQEIYGEALETAIEEKAKFFRKLVDVMDGKYTAPVEYNTPELVEKWKRGFVTELARQNNLIGDIGRHLAAAGADVEPVIKKSMAELYGINRKYAVEFLEGEAHELGLEGYFNQYSQRQIDILLSDGQSNFSKIAYKNLGKDTVIVRRLKNEMAQAVLLGEGQEKILKRIQKVTGQSVKQARRVVQTERTRLQSQARQQSLSEAATMGLNVKKEWSTRMKKTRDTHEKLNGKKIAHDEKFESISGAMLEYPGDPSAPAREVCNCHCVLTPDVEA